jgi:hypothetical protein
MFAQALGKAGVVENNFDESTRRGYLQDNIFWLRETRHCKTGRGVHDLLGWLAPCGKLHYAGKIATGVFPLTPGGWVRARIVIF